MKLSATDLFCGSGGLSAGFIDAGIEIVAAYDNWGPAIVTYRRNIGDHAHQADLSDVSQIARDIAATEPDIIAGGPPCQDFSTAGKRVEGGRANLTVAFAEIISICRPRYFLMENVPQVRKSLAYQNARRAWESAGYEIAETTLDASYCNVPQARKRFFAFGSLCTGDASKFLAFIEERLNETQLTIKQYLSEEIDIEYYYRHPRNYSRRSVFSVLEPSPTIRGVNRPVPPNYQGNHLDSAPPSSVRPLTSWERSRIQTFPATWQWGGTDRGTDVELQIGNAVPVNLASFVASGIVHVTR